MSLATEPLPANPSVLRIFAADLQAELARKDIEIAANAAEIHAKTLHIEKLKMQLAVLRRARFGRSSEKLNRDIEQLELLIGALEQDAAAEDARTSTAEPDMTTDPKTSARTHQRKQPVRAPLPAHLPRETVTHEPACICAGCGGTTFSRIGQDEREVLEYVPSSFKVIQHVRPKLSCRSCETKQAAEQASDVLAASISAELQPHCWNVFGHHDLGFSRGNHVRYGYARTGFQQRGGSIRKSDDREFCHDKIHPTYGGKR